ncbi:serine/threonine protein kinase [Pseudobutyrivibrio xylanivorans]|uniref:non-specific serine/threonine protein kinase n=1 Tax=Pseudobutyrivibrio xylanivorans TaxID=185007 RepID=A0A5P6VSC1_PSEXY|nr:protein kinase [Pseudobutyrivibrio xylanivorans]QFJ54104.1 protein kinase [Pseudobutyrivibrio xylanivorans]
MIPKGIDDRYEVIRVLRESAATAVILVNYKKIGALRILKAIHRAHPDANSILSEAHLLQGIKSSQIPTIYEVEDTEEMIYLVEEYVEGISLREYLLKTKITKEKLIAIAIEICKVVETLHTAGSEPVLYRDMKPEHCIMQRNTIKLIDFGISIAKSEADRAKPVGTKDWAAPEQQSGRCLDERCDVYGVGKVIGFMQINSYAKDDFRIKRIVECATEVDVERRIQSITELRRLLENLQGDRVYDGIGKTHLDRKIAVIGGTHAVGTTRIAISMCRFFNKRKIDCYYKDIERNTVLNLWRNLKNTKLDRGVLYHEGFRGIPEYGENVEHFRPPDGLYIYDCGTNINVPVDTDLIIYVMGGAPWQMAEDYPEWIKNENVYVVTNFSDRLTSVLLAKDIGKKVYKYPTVKGNGLSKDEEKCFSAIFKNNKDFIIT